MSIPRTPPPRKPLPRPANDNEPPVGPLVAKVLNSKDLHVTQVDLEVFAALWDDWTTIAANDNEET